MAIERTARGQIQAVVGDRGAVLPRVEQTDIHAGRPYVGWYADPAAAVKGCSCGFCAAARDGQAAYLGFHSRDAIVRASEWAGQHPVAA